MGKLRGSTIFAFILITSLLCAPRFAFCQSISLSPISGTVGTSVTVTGSSFMSNSPIIIRYDGSQVTNSTTSSTGWFTVSFEVPSSTRGPHSVTTTDGINTRAATFTVTSATLSRSPTSGTVGTTVTLTGYSFAPSSSIVIKWDGTVLATSPSSIMTDANGAFVASMLVPNGEPVVPHRINATDGAVSTIVTFTISSRIVLSPSSGTEGTVVLVSGSGFLSSSLVSITFDGSAVTTTPSSVTTDPVGIFAASFVVPSASPGSHTVKATDSTGNSALATFTSIAFITLSTATGRGGTSVTVTGVGFTPSSTVAIRFDGTTLLSASTDSSGGFTQVITVPLVPAGSHIISATDGSRTGTASFSVTPSISLSASSGTVGSVLVVTGTGFASSTAVTVSFAGSPVATTPSPLATDAYGGFTCSLSVPSASAGSWSVRAIDSSGFQSGATFTVTRKLSLSSTTGVVGTVVVARGTGFAPSAQITLAFDAQTLTTSPSPIFTDPEGRYNCSFQIPESNGQSHTIVAADDMGGSISSTYTVTDSISLNPTSGNAGTTVSVTGTGFGQNTLVTLSYDGSSVVTTPTPVETNVLGTFSASFIVSQSAPGSHTVRATDLFGNTATASFTITRRLSLSSHSGVIFVALTVTGTGFDPSSPVSLTWDGSALSALPSTLVTDAAGAFRAVITIPRAIVGPHVVEASDVSVNKASDSYTVTPSVIVTPSGLGVGDELWLTGEGFAGSSLVEITWDGSSVVTKPSTITTSFQGSFEASFVIPLSAFGNHRVVAVDQTGNSSSSSYTLSATSAIDVELDVGPIYFRGEVAEFYALISKNGRPFDASTLTAELFLPGGAVQDLSSSTVKVDTGTYRIDYVVPGGALAGTYALVANASKLFDGAQSYGAQIKAFEVSSTFSQMNATLVDMYGTLGSLTLDTGPVLIRLDEINASISSLIRSSNGEIMAQISSRAGTITTKLDLISASLSSVANGVATIFSSLGSVRTDLNTIDAKIVSVVGDVAYIRTVVGSLSVEVSDLNPKLIAINESFIKFHTDLGAIDSKLGDLNVKSIDIQNGIVRIETGLGSITAELVNLTGVSLSVITPGGTERATLFTDVDLLSAEYKADDNAVRVSFDRGSQSSGKLTLILPKNLLILIGSSPSKFKLLLDGTDEAFSLSELTNAFLLQANSSIGQHTVILYLNGVPNAFPSLALPIGLIALLAVVIGAFLTLQRRKKMSRNGL